MCGKGDVAGMLAFFERFKVVRLWGRGRAGRVGSVAQRKEEREEKRKL